MGMVIISATGFIGMAWLYVSALLDPAPAPLHSVTWIDPAVILLVLVVFQLSGRRKGK
ncbi:hypothetical protein ANI01nite_32160 [Glutamicibacter nicotianae]|uniref:Uncharacterized protein n=1 Tax=Glutamicibacter nicotianae TaxID=37929 RepID=A0ABQ0RQD4_GLUNI|nr:hypothetical protein ANI01nite_32160 [Glutamicibacter nicotianae]